MVKSNRNSHRYLMFVLGFLAAFAPLVTDMYLPGLPAMTKFFGTTVSLVQLGITASMIGLAAGQLFVGPVSDKYGRRRPLIASIATFIISTIFCIFANKVLKQYLLQGYAINERIASQKFDELSQLVKVLGRTIQNQERLTEDSRSLLNVEVDYTYALDTLDRYDYQELTIEKTTARATFHATYEKAKKK
jgi:hypothetical protein